MFWTNQFHLTLTSLYIIINPISFPLHFQTTAICRAVIALNPAAQTLVGLEAELVEVLAIPVALGPGEAGTYVVLRRGCRGGGARIGQLLHSGL